jgi:cell wall-associated NlpC family hydrolase
MTKIEAQKKWFMTTAMRYIGTPYVWGGDDPAGFDCSGFVNECLKSIGVIGDKEDFTAAGLLAKFQPELVPGPVEAGILFLLNGAGQAYHVVICLDEYHHVGADGGGSKTQTVADAWAQNAYIKVRPIRFDPARMRVVNLFKEVTQ